MLKELTARPESGFLGPESFLGVIVQCWRSFGGMPAFGLGKVGRLLPATGTRETARGRMSPSVATPSGL